MAAGPTDAVLIAPPQPVCAAEVKKMAWTADGSYLVVERRSVDPNSEGGEILVWGRRSGKARTITLFDPRSVTVDEIEPMGGTDRFVVQETDVVREGEARGTYQRVTLISASSGTIVPIGLVRQDANSSLITVLVSPTRPFGILERIDEKTKIWRAFGPDGRLGAEVAVKRTDGLTLDREGDPIQIERTDAVEGKLGKLQSRRIDLTSGKMGEWKPWTYSRGEPQVGPYSVQTLTVGSLKGVRAPGIVLSLLDGKEDEGGVISTDGSNPVLSPKGEAIAYVDQGVGMVRALTRIDRKVYDAAVRQRQIAEMVGRAKQIGLGLLQYAADKKDVLPGQGVNLQSAIGPYLKDNSLLEGFNYTFAGGDESEIEEPATTEMGYISGPGGRAVIYADGHAKWVPDRSRD